MYIKLRLDIFHMKENYSIQAENLMSQIIKDYTISVGNFKVQNLVLKSIKSIKVKIADRTRNISDLSEIQYNDEIQKWKLTVYNKDYINKIVIQIDETDLSYYVEGQFIIIDKPIFTYNQLLELIEQIEKYTNKVLLNCSKAKLEPILRARNGVENQFIDNITAQFASQRSQEIYEKYEVILQEKKLQKIKNILGIELFKKYKADNFLE